MCEFNQPHHHEQDTSVLKLDRTNFKSEFFLVLDELPYQI